MAYEKELIINSDNFSVCFNSMQITYPTLDQIITKMDFIEPNDTVNVFLNIESLIRNLSMVRDVERKIYMAGDDFSTLIASKIINYAAHYKSFFRRNNLRTYVYLYMTDFNSTMFNESEINPDYRCYYRTKYTKNPKFTQLSEAMEKKIIPMVSTILEFIEGVYFINTLNIEATVVPMVIGSLNPTRKNIIISSDKVETQYSFKNNYRMIYLKRGAGSSVMTGSLLDFIAEITKRPKDTILNEGGSLYSNRGFYILLLSVLGDKYRTVEGISKVGYSTLSRMISKGIDENIITSSTTNPELLSRIFDDSVVKDVIDNYNILDLERRYEMLTKEQVNTITSMLIDKSDIRSLQKLNGTNFYKYNLNLEALTQ